MDSGFLRMDAALLKRSMNLSVAEGSLATIMGTLTSGVFLTGFALEMGATRLQIGVLSALPVCANLVQLGGAYLLERRGECKNLCLLTTVISRLLWLPIFLVPFLFANSGPFAIWVMIAAFAIGSFLSSIGGVAWLLWIKDLIPKQQRVSFLGRRHLFNTGLSLVAGMVAAVGLDWAKQSGQSSLGFLSVFGAAMLCGLIGMPLLGAIPAPGPAHPHQASFHQLFSDPLRNRDFRTLLGFYGVWNIGLQLAQPFFAVYMLQKMHLSFGCITALATMSSVLGMLTTSFWTRLCNQFGTKPIVLIATIADLVTTIAWVFVMPQWFGLLVLIHCSGLFSAPLAMGPNNILLRLAPEKNAAFYLAIFNSIIGTAAAVAAIAGGLVATVFMNWSLSLGPIEIGGLKLVFILSTAVRLLSLPLLARVVEPDAGSVSQMIRVLRFRQAPAIPAIVNEKQAA
ncbi:MAG: major facilitator transporter [Schlesneria sp.]|nr:major facilitator transporter [Schlesneria sp.]